jgi:hypothetical protein
MGLAASGCQPPLFLENVMSDYPWLLPELDPFDRSPVDDELGEFLEENDKANMRVLAEINVRIYDRPRHDKNATYAGYLLSLVVVDEMMNEVAREELPAWVNLVNRHEMESHKQVQTIGTTSLRVKHDAFNGETKLDINQVALVAILCQHIGLDDLEEDQYFAELHVVR